ncbi:hypothetical protein LINGRAHAP2_LOCUS5542 [Linum grandiflorum]
MQVYFPCSGEMNPFCIRITGSSVLFDSFFVSRSSGWPLGLQIMSLRLRLTEINNNNNNRTTQAAGSNQPDHNNLFITSSSFSSFSSSNLDTESTASFFQDNSVSFGRLIGYRAAEHHRGGNVNNNGYFPSRSNGRAATALAMRSNNEADCGDEIVRMSSEGPQGICIPLILSTIDKINRRKDRSN